MTHPRVIALALLCLGSSCATKDTAYDESSEAMGFSKRLNQKHGYAQDGEGNWVPKSRKRSSFETQGEAPYFNNSVKNKSFSTQNYATKSWWGKQEMPRRPYPTSDSRKSFQTQSPFQGQHASGADAAARIPDNLQTQDHITNAAFETNAKRFSKTQDAETALRRRVYANPKIIDYEEKRRITLEESKKILGR